MPMNPFINNKLAANGLTVAENFSAWFDKSLVVDAHGAPKVVFHSTFNDFDAFASSKDLGFHFGSAAVAQGRIAGNAKSRGSKASADEKYAGLNILPVHLSIGNPLHLDTDPLSWVPLYLLKLIGDRLPAAAHKSLIEMDTACVAAAGVQARVIRQADGPGLIRKKTPWTPSGVRIELQNAVWFKLLALQQVPWYTQLRKDIQRAGFDGLTYLNEVEGEGRGSKGRKANPENMTWVAFEASQVKSVIGNSGLYLKDSASMTDWQADKELRLAARARACIPSRLTKPLSLFKSLGAHA